MKIKRLDHVGIRVMKFDRAINCYEKFGFSVTRQDSKEHVVVLKHDSGVEINLLDSGSDDNNQKNVLMDMTLMFVVLIHNPGKLWLKNLMGKLGITCTQTFPSQQRNITRQYHSDAPFRVGDMTH